MTSMRSDDGGDTRGHDNDSSTVEGGETEHRSDLSMHIDLGEPALWLPHDTPVMIAPPPAITMTPDNETPTIIDGDSFLARSEDDEETTTTTSSLYNDYMDATRDEARGNYGAIESHNTPIPFRQEALWSSLGLCFFGLLLVALLSFTLSPTFQRFVVRNANALFTIPYVISFVVILACLAPWVPSHAGSLTQMNVGVIASASDYLLILLVLIEWAVCLALMLVTLVAVHDGLSYISVDGVIVPRDANNNNTLSAPQPVPDSAVGGIPHNSPLILIVPVLTLYALFNVIMHTYSCCEALVRRRMRLSDTDIVE